MRQYDNYQLLHEVVCEAINPKYLNIAKNAALPVAGGVVGGVYGYKKYDKRLLFLKDQFKKAENKFNRDWIRREIEIMEKLGKKKWTAIYAAGGAAGGAALRSVHKAYKSGKAWDKEFDTVSKRMSGYDKEMDAIRKKMRNL